jgi:hypothetical protein
MLVIFLPKETFSEIENRSLASFPKVNLANVENKKAMDGIENYISDHFPARVFWVKTKTAFEIAIGKREINDVYISKERFLQKITSVDDEVINGNINGINTFANRYDIPVYVMIAPTSAGIYTENIPFDAPNLDQKKYIENIYNLLDEKVTPIEIFDDLYKQKNDYIYYRTDHHWATKGAFFAYEKAAEKLGFTPLPIDSFTIESVTDDFYGSFHSKVLYDNIKADTVDIYHNQSGVELTKVERYRSLDTAPNETETMYIRGDLIKKNKYTVFFGGDRAYISIKSSSKGGKILVIKDSYANCFVPFLTEHYSEIVMIDMRFINISLDEFLDMNEFDSVLFLYNAVSFNTDNNLRKFELL